MEKTVDDILILKDDLVVESEFTSLRLGSEVRFEGGIIKYAGTGVLAIYGKKT